MELIDKAAVVAEIKRRLSLLESGTGHPEVVKRIDGVIKGYKNILSFLDSLEVKEVDLEVVAYLADKGYPVSTAGEIPTYQETFDMVKNAIEYSNKQEHQNLDETRRECWWYNNGYLKGRQDAHIPARELGLPKFYDFQQEQPEVDLEKEYRNFVEDDAVYSKLVNNIVGKSIAKHFYKLGLKAQKGE